MSGSGLSRTCKMQGAGFCTGLTGPVLIQDCNAIRKLRLRETLFFGGGRGWGGGVLKTCVI